MMFLGRNCIFRQISTILGKETGALTRSIDFIRHQRHCLHRLTALTFARGYSSVQPPPPSKANTSDWEFDVSPFGTFTVRTGAIASVFVKPIDPQKYPMQNKAFIKVTAQEDGTDDATISCSAEDSKIVLMAEHDDPSADKKLFSCDIELPIKFDLDLEVDGGRDLAVKGFENHYVVMRSDKGACYMFSLKTDTADVHTLGGNIVCKSYIQANGTFSTCLQGDVLLDRVLGLSLDVITEEGEIDVKAVYSDQSRFSTDSGNIHLKSCHRSSEVEIGEAGNLTVGTLDGDMKASINQGDVDIYFTQHGRVDLNVNKGNMLLQLTDSADTEVDLFGSKVKFDDDLVFTSDDREQKGESHKKGHLVHSSVSPDKHDSLLEKPQRLIKAHTKNGSITVDCKDWLSSLKLSPSNDLDEDK